MATPAISSSLITRRSLLATAAGTLFLSACGRDDEQSGGPEPGRQELVIGTSLELTGAGAALGVLQERAMQITAESLNIEGIPVGNMRRTIRVVVRDNKSDPELAAQQAEELTQRDKVAALVGGTLTETSLAIIKVAQELQVPFISLAHGDDIVQPLSERTYVYKLTPDAADVAPRLARVIRSRKLDEVALLAARGRHGDDGARAMPTALAAANVDLVRTVRLPETGTDFTGAAVRVARREPAGVVIWATAPDSGAAARALRRAGYAGPLFFDSGAVAEDTLADANAAAVEGAFVVSPISLAGSTLTTTTTAALARREFIYRYIQKHGGFSGFAPYGADGVRLLVTGARLANSVDRGRLRAYLQAQVTDGIAGTYDFSPNRHGGMASDSLGVFTVSHGSWTRVS